MGFLSLSLDDDYHHKDTLPGYIQIHPYLVCSENSQALTADNLVWEMTNKGGEVGGFFGAPIRIKYRAGDFSQFLATPQNTRINQINQDWWWMDGWMDGYNKVASTDNKN